MLRFFGLVVSLVLGIIFGSRTGAMMQSELIGFVCSFISFICFALISLSMISILEIRRQHEQLRDTQRKYDL